MIGKDSLMDGELYEGHASYKGKGSRPIHAVWSADIDRFLDQTGVELHYYWEDPDAGQIAPFPRFEPMSVYPYSYEEED